jgi:DNA repair protein RadD
VELRDYQDRAVRGVFQWWRAGVKRVLVVMPTGGGKTATAAFVAHLAKNANKRVLWVTHTTDLVEQSQRNVPDAKVVSIQGLLTSLVWPPADVIIVDEAHHFVADDWGSIFKRYPDALFLGLTATPERADGRPLGDVFEQLIVAVHYSELLQRGILVPCRILRPATKLERGIARDPVEAYLELGERRQGFMYVPSIDLAEACASRLNAVGVPSFCIHAKTNKLVRQQAIEQFSTGQLQVLTNVYALTEGVDVPAASCAVFGRGFGHVSQMLQAAGRVLRSSPGKEDALLLDLAGVTHDHGVPLEDREYALTGEGIRRQANASLRVCLKCGYTWPGQGACPRCGFGNPTQAKKMPRIYNAELLEVYAGAATPSWAKRAELDRLRKVAEDKGLSDGWVSHRYRDLFEQAPEFDNDAVRRRAEYDKLKKVAAERGYKTGWAKQRYKALYAAWPPKGWDNDESAPEAQA